MRALEVKLTDGSVHVVREPKGAESPTVMKALLPVVRLPTGTGKVSTVEMFEHVLADQEATDALIELVGLLSDMPAKEVGELGFGDYYAMLQTTLTMAMPAVPLVKTTRSRSRSTKAG